MRSALRKRPDVPACAAAAPSAPPTTSRRFTATARALRPADGGSR